MRSSSAHFNPNEDSSEKYSSLASNISVAPSQSSLNKTSFFSSIHCRTDTTLIKDANQTYAFLSLLDNSESPQGKSPHFSFSQLSQSGSFSKREETNYCSCSRDSSRASQKSFIVLNARTTHSRDSISSRARQAFGNASSVTTALLRTRGIRLSSPVRTVGSYLLI